MEKMTKKEIQKRVLQNEKPLELSKFTWDKKTKTFYSTESNLVFNFNKISGCTFNTYSYCTFKTGSDCTFKTDACCAFDTGYDCKFDTGYDCTFKTDSYCTFKTGSDCTFKTGSDCNFDTGSDCKFDTGSDCTFKTDSYCTFKTGSDCNFDNGSIIYYNSKNNRFPFILKMVDARRIIEAACSGWKTRLAEQWGLDLLLNNQVMINKDEYEEMRKACTKEQNELFDDIFGKDAKKLPVYTLVRIKNGGSGAIGCSGKVGFITKEEPDSGCWNKGGVGYSVRVGSHVWELGENCELEEIK